jgi:hypothetical protein
MCRPCGEGRTHRCAPTRARLPAIVQWFKTMTTNEYLRGVKTSGWAPFQGQLWQRNYYAHVIRDEVSLNRIRDTFLTTRRSGPLIPRTQPQPLPNLQTYGDCRNGGKVRTNGPSTRLGTLSSSKCRSPLRVCFGNNQNRSDRGQRRRRDPILDFGPRGRLPILDSGMPDREYDRMMQCLKGRVYGEGESATANLNKSKGMSRQTLHSGHKNYGFGCP